MPCFAVPSQGRGTICFLRVRHDFGINQEHTMMGEPSVGLPPSERPLDDQLDSWKEIASYLKRDVTTVQRWEKREGMPVHRHLHDKIGSVYAFRVELDAWTHSRNLRAAEEEARSDAPLSSPLPQAGLPTSDSSARWKFVLFFVALASTLAIAVIVWFQRQHYQRHPKSAEPSQTAISGGAQQASALESGKTPFHPHSIVLADFANSTGNPVFDDTLKQALTIALRQSPFLTVVSDEKA